MFDVMAVICFALVALVPPPVHWIFVLPGEFALFVLIGMNWPRAEQTNEEGPY